MKKLLMMCCLSAFISNIAFCEEAKTDSVQVAGEKIVLKTDSATAKNPVEKEMTKAEKDSIYKRQMDSVKRAAVNQVLQDFDRLFKKGEWTK